MSQDGDSTRRLPYHAYNPQSPSSPISPAVYEGGLEVQIQDAYGPVLVPDRPDAYALNGSWEEEKEIATGRTGSRQTAESTPSHEKKGKASTICGIKRGLFIVIAVIMGILLVGGIVGGAVGGTRATKQSTPQRQK
jgi:hypothetical protein